MIKKIAVFSRFQGISEKILIGIANKFQTLANWNMIPYAAETHFDLEDFKDQQFDGVIFVDVNQEVKEQLKELNLPTIQVLNTHDDNGPKITVDDQEIGNMAAQHLLGRGFKHIAYVGGIESESAKRRYYSFKEQLDQNEVTLHLFSETFPSNDERVTNSKNWISFRKRLSTWLEAIPKPIGLFALDDWMAFHTQLCCRNLGIRIPEDLAVIGVNDDDLVCQISMPTLSSIRLPLEKMGYESADSIIKLVENRPFENSVLKPIGLVTRESTNTFAVRDKVVEEALKFMQQEGSKPIRVEEVLKHVGVSRSLLERRFRGEIGRTPLVEMRRQRVERARGLLADTELAINKISNMCGFASNIRFTTVFREQVGITPSEFRSQMQHSN